MSWTHSKMITKSNKEYRFPPAEGSVWASLCFPSDRCRLCSCVRPNEDVPSAPWQSSPRLFCLPRCPTSVLTAAFNVQQSRATSQGCCCCFLGLFFFRPNLTDEGARVWQARRSGCCDCDLIKRGRVPEPGQTGCCSSDVKVTPFIAITEVFYTLCNVASHRRRIIIYVFQGPSLHVFALIFPSLWRFIISVQVKWWTVRSVIACKELKVVKELSGIWMNANLN